MNIPESVTKIKGQFKNKVNFDLTHDLFVIALIILVALASFALGRLSALDGKKTPIRIESKEEISALPDPFSKASKSADVAGTDGSTTGEMDTTSPGTKSFVASKTGKKYYAPWCTAVSRMSEQSKVWFASKEDAEAKGYTKALNCKGM